MKLKHKILCLVEIVDVNSTFFCEFISNPHFSHLPMKTLDLIPQFLFCGSNHHKTKSRTRLDYRSVVKLFILQQYEICPIENTNEIKQTFQQYRSLLPFYWTPNSSTVSFISLTKNPFPNTTTVQDQENYSWNSRHADRIIFRTLPKNVPTVWLVPKGSLVKTCNLLL